MDELTLTDIVAAASLPSGGGSKKKTTNTCRQDGCQNIVVRGKLCYKHLPLPSSTFCMPIGTSAIGGGGGIIDGVVDSNKYQDGRDKHGHKNCSHPSCQNIVVQGGVCLKHGARKQLCTYINPLTNEVCTNLAKQGGVCTRHGARREARKQCSHVDPESGEQCTKVARKGGTCIRHGSIERTCAFEGCTNNIVNNGVCKRHGAIVKICKFDGCDNQVKKRGLCVRHQSASPDECGEVRTISQCVHVVAPPKYNDPNNNIDKHNRAICNFEGGCTNVAHRRGLCIRHGNPQNYYKKKATPKKDKDEIPKPYTEYTMFFKLEQALFTQEDGSVGDEILTSLDPNHKDELEFPRPARYANVILPPFWYSSQHKKEIEKKRKHRKRPGRMNLTELSKSISVNWRNASDEVVAYCKRLAMAEKLKYGMIMELAMKEKKKEHAKLEELARLKKERDTVQQLVNAQKFAKQYQGMMNAAQLNKAVKPDEYPCARRNSHSSDFPQVTMGMFSKPFEKKDNFSNYSANKYEPPPSSEPTNSILGGDEAAAASALFTLRKTGGKRDSSTLSTTPMEEGPPMKSKKMEAKPMEPSPFSGHAASHSVRPPASSRVRPTSPATNPAPLAHFQHMSSLIPTVHSGFQSGTSTSAIMTAMMNKSRMRGFQSGKSMSAMMEESHMRGFQSGMQSLQNRDARMQNPSFGSSIFPPASRTAFPSAQPMWNYPQPNHVQPQSDAFRAILAMRAAREESSLKVAMAREALAREKSTMKVAMAREAVAKANEQLMKANEEFQKVHSTPSVPSPDGPMKRRSSFNSAA